MKGEDAIVLTLWIALSVTMLAFALGNYCAMDPRDLALGREAYKGRSFIEALRALPSAAKSRPEVPSR
jgi:ABC-type Fe3+ transport system permease subunit